MTLADRLSQVQVAGAPTLERRGVPRRAVRHADPFAALKRSENWNSRLPTRCKRCCSATRHR